MGDHYYILDGHTPKPASLHEWANWFETAVRHVALTEIGTFTVSTVFLGLDHNYGDGPPLLFETMVFNGDTSGQMKRCSTWDEAIAQHAEIVGAAAVIELRTQTRH